MQAIYISIKPVHLRKIERKEKNYEFRSRIPKRPFDTIFVYESSPTCMLRYMIELGNIVKYPEKILKDGKGNQRFNAGLHGKYCYAYEIKRFYEFENPLPLKELKEKYQFSAPQSFAYQEKYPDLSKRLEHLPKKLLVEW